MRSDRVRSMATRTVMRVAALGVALALVGGVGTLSGCARGGDSSDVVPAVVVDLVVQFAAPVVDAFYYYIAIDADSDLGADGPLPVAAGPRWGNGWGNGNNGYRRGWGPGWW